MVSQLSPEEIAQLIVKRDRAFGPTVKRVGPPPKRRNAPLDKRFPALIESIASQLVSIKAADTIYARIVAICDGEVSPRSLAAAGFESIRSAGLSTTKAQAMLELSGHVLIGQINIEQHHKMPSSEVAKELMSVRGIGPWTAEMYLLFSLARQDVWPHLDYGVRAGWSSIHALPEMISIKELKAAGAVFAGVESHAAWYCWRALEHERQQFHKG